MSLAVVYSRASIGIQAPLVTIEVHLSKGLPGLSIVGLPEKAVKESKDRVRSAIINSQFEFPVRRITVNLAPADLPKEGGRFDLPIALGILAASEQIPKEVLSAYEFAGELALNGELRSVKGILPFAMATQHQQRFLVIPEENAMEARLSSNTVVFPARHILDICAHLTGKQNIEACIREGQSVYSRMGGYADLADVQGQMQGRRALEIAAAGGHSLLMRGPPGTGKTMLASRLPGILPDLTPAEALGVAAVYSISHLGFNPDHWLKRPFRNPHHTISSAALVGGGNPPQPGEISLAHEGVLFLDELPEFSRHVLDALREPLEAGVVSISRASRQAQFPAHFQLVAAMNPCPCGYLGDPSGRCRCTLEQAQRYQSRISGPLLDRIDMNIEVSSLPIALLLQAQKRVAESSAVVRERVIRARQCQYQRHGKTNALLVGEEVLQHCILAPPEQIFLEKAVTQLGLSARAYHRILKLARTIADLDEQVNIDRHHLQEALSLRGLERRNGPG